MKIKNINNCEEQTAKNLGIEPATELMALLTENLEENKPYFNFEPNFSIDFFDIPDEYVEKHILAEQTREEPEDSYFSIDVESATEYFMEAYELEQEQKDNISEWQQRKLDRIDVLIRKALYDAIAIHGDCE